MKITKQKLREIIKEELSSVLDEPVTTIKSPTIAFANGVPLAAVIVFVEAAKESVILVSFTLASCTSWFPE